MSRRGLIAAMIAATCRGLPFILLSAAFGQEVIPQRADPPSSAPASSTATPFTPPRGGAASDGDKSKTAEGDKEKKADEAAKSKPVTDSPSLKLNWRNGVQLESEDKSFRLHIGGLIHADAGWWNAPEALMYGPGGVGALNDGANFRRVRWHTLGSMYDTVTWALEVGFENRLPQFFNVYAEVPNLPAESTIRLGHFREPFGTDALTSYNNLTFLERSLLLEPLVPFFNMGLMLYGPWLKERATYAAGVFRSNSDSFNAADFGDGNYAYTSRLTFTPWYECQGSKVLHLGMAQSYRVLPFLDAAGVPTAVGGLRRVVLAARPEVRVGTPNFVSTGVITADREHLIGAEVALLHGPVLVQGEYIGGIVGNAALTGVPAGPRGSLYFQGFSVQASCFLTREVRPYVRREGVFGQVKPHTSFRPRRRSDEKYSPQRGPGAWEIAARYSRLDLNSDPIRGGGLHDVTLGLNWYLNPQCRLLLNHVLIWREAAEPRSSGFAQALTTRFQLEF